MATRPPEKQKAINRDIAIGKNAGRPPKQAVAIALKNNGVPPKPATKPEPMNTAKQSRASQQPKGRA